MSTAKGRARRLWFRRLSAAEGLGGGGSVEPLMRAEEDVAGEGGFEHSFQAPDGERATETKVRGHMKDLEAEAGKGC